MQGSTAVSESTSPRSSQWTLTSGLRVKSKLSKPWTTISSTPTGKQTFLQIIRSHLSRLKRLKWQDFWLRNMWTSVGWTRKWNTTLFTFGQTSVLASTNSFNAPWIEQEEILKSPS